MTSSAQGGHILLVLVLLLALLAQVVLSALQLAADSSAQARYQQSQLLQVPSAAQ